MPEEDGRVTILEGQFRRLAELFSKSSHAVEVKQYGSVLRLNNGSTKLAVNADGDDIHPPNQEHLW
jgi:hypothetical protein